MLTVSCLNWPSLTDLHPYSEILELDLFIKDKCSHTVGPYRPMPFNACSVEEIYLIYNYAIKYIYIPLITGTDIISLYCNYSKYSM